MFALTATQRAGAPKRCRQRGRLASLAARVALFVLCATLTASATSSARAAPTLLTSSYQIAGEEAIGLAGDATVVAGDEGERANIIRAFVPGARPTVLARVAPSTGDSTLAGLVQLAASSARLAVLDVGDVPGYKGSPGTRYPLLASGPLGGALQEQTAGCQLAPVIDPSVTHFEEGFLPTHAIALDGDVLAYDSYGCLVVEDFSSGMPRIIPLQATIDPVSKGRLIELSTASLLQVAGHLVAYRSNPPGGEGAASVVVYDIESGTVLYSVPLADFELGERPPPTFALQADGTVVIASEPSQGVCAATVSAPAHPSPTPLSVSACSVYGLNDGRALVIAPAASGRMLAWTSLEDPALHPIADLGREAELATTRPATDGINVAYSLKSCWRPDVYMTALTEPGAPPARARRCPIVVAANHATEGRSHIKVRVACPLGCEGELEASAGTTAQIRHDRAPTVARTRISLAPGHVAAMTLPSKEEEDEGEELAAVRAVARQLRHHDHVELRLRLSVETLRVPESTRIVRVIP